LGGLEVPGADVSAMAGGGLFTFGSAPVGTEARVYGAVYRAEDSHTRTTGAVLVLHETYWWNVYGLGAGSGLGYAGFHNKGGGWGDNSAQVVVYLAPVMLRFGRQPTFELGLNAGATRFFSHDVRPYGYFYGGILF
jgi:hypothetical protein